MLKTLGRFGYITAPDFQEFQNGTLILRTTHMVVNETIIV